MLRYVLAAVAALSLTAPVKATTPALVFTGTTTGYTLLRELTQGITYEIDFSDAVLDPTVNTWFIYRWNDYNGAGQYTGGDESYWIERNGYLGAITAMRFVVPLNPPLPSVVSLGDGGYRYQGVGFLFNELIAGTDHELAFSIFAVPEASTWAMMLVGFGLIGVAVRRRKYQLKAA